MKSILSSIRSLVLASLASGALALLPTTVHADRVVDGSTVYFTDHVGYTDDGTAYSGTVALRMDNVVVSGQSKIVTTIVSITPEPGFAYSVKKSGGANGTM